MFQDRVDIWEEIEAKVDSENNVPFAKTSNKVSVLLVEWQDKHMLVNTACLSQVRRLCFRKSHLSWKNSGEFRDNSKVSHSDPLETI